jgi:hypothetical protein
MMQKHVSALVQPDRLNVRLLGSTVLAIVPLLVNYYVLLVLPFMDDDGKGRIDNIVFWPTVAAITLAFVLYNRSHFDKGFISSLPVMSLFAYLVFAGASVSWAFSPDLAFSRFVAGNVFRHRSSLVCPRATVSRLALPPCNFWNLRRRLATV